MNGRCAACLLRIERCLCASVPRVDTRIEIVIVRHLMERWKPSNSARAAALALPRATLVEHGADDPRARAALDEALAPRLGTWLLYPCEGRPDAHPPSEGRIERLIVLDGSWSQTRRMSQRLAALRALPRLSLAAPSPARRRLRRPNEPHQLSTLEAIAVALERIEGAAVARPLRALYDQLVARCAPY